MITAKPGTPILFIALAVAFALLALAGMPASAQRLPDFYGLNQVRIVTPEGAVTAEILPSGKEPATETERSYYWYGGNVIHTTQGGYSGRLLNGRYNAYYPNKNLREQGQFRSGLKIGPWRSWDEGGRLRSLVTWKKGVRSGAFIDYSEQGMAARSGTYRNDQLSGKVLTYQGGDSVETARYKAGVLIKEKPAEVNHRPFWKKLWPFGHHQPGDRKIKPPRPPKVKKPRKLSTPDLTGSPQQN